MYLNRRPVLDPRFPFFAREAVSGSMMGTVKIYSISAVDPGSAWNPLASTLEGRQPVSSLNREEVFAGQARIQPNKDWRARKIEVDGQIATEHAIRFQVDLQGNLAPRPDYAPSTGYWFPKIGPGDEIEVVSVFEAEDGTPTDDAVLDYNYVVRTPSSASNGWMRTLLCDIIVNDQANGPVH